MPVFERALPPVFAQAVALANLSSLPLWLWHMNYQGPLREYLRAGRFRATPYCTPAVCVPDVIGGLAVTACVAA